MISKTASAVIVALLILSGALIGQESIDQLLWGDDIYITTASKTQEHASDAPAAVIIITEEMIKERGYRDLKDIFSDLPGFDISTNIYGEFSTLIAQRGIGGNNKIVLLLNGTRITSPSGKQFQFGNNVPVWNLKKIEIVYGPASALYGADAFSVVNMITKDAEDEEEIHVDLVAGQDNTFDVYMSVNRRLSEDISLNVFARKYKSDGPDLSDEYPELSSEYSGIKHYGYNDPTDDMNLFVNAEIRDFSILFHYSDYNEQLSKALEPQDHYMYSDDAYWGHSLWQLALKHKHTRNKLSIKTDATYSQFEIDPEMNWVYFADYMPDNKLKVHQYGIMEKYNLETQFDYDLTGDLNAIAGLSHSELMGMPTGDKTGDPFDTEGPLRLNNFYNDLYPQNAIRETEHAAYLQLRYRFSDELNFVGGFRYDYNSKYKETNNPRVGAIFRKDDTTLKLLFGGAYIAPGLFHRYETWFTEEYGHIQNLDLKPEKLKTVEVNWTQNFSEKLKTSIGIYYNDVKDLIVRKSYGPIEFRPDWYADGGWVDANGDSSVWVEWSTNFGKLTSYGVDVPVYYLFSPDLKIFASYSFLDGEITDPETGDKSDIFKTSQHKISGGLTYILFDKLYITPRFRWASEIVTRQENSIYKGDRMPGYDLFFLNLHYKDVIDNLDAHLSINNLLNKSYYTAGVATEGSNTYLPRVPQNLMTITGGVSYRF